MNVKELISKVECWPNENQTLLLKAALNKDQSAFDSWRKWSSKVDFENTDSGSYRLYPLVYRNLTDLKTEAKQIPDIFKGVYRYYWSFSNRLFIKVSSILKVLNEQKIPVLLLKGAPLAINFYENIATRPVRDIDIMIQPQHLNHTIDILSQNDFFPTSPIKKNTFKFNHAVCFKNNDGFEIDLHLSVISENLYKKQQQTYWEQSQEMNFFGQKTQTLCPTDHLFHTLV
ncbi:nucleotidyltransferase family protein, partial [Tenacibaculum sp.]|nr:nucleotidyltransferase family protein [Tenacibaculum sp.]